MSDLESVKVGDLVAVPNESWWKGIKISHEIMTVTKVLKSKFIAGGMSFRKSDGLKHCSVYERYASKTDRVFAVPATKEIIELHRRQAEMRKLYEGIAEKLAKIPAMVNRLGIEEVRKVYEQLSKICDG